MEVEISLLINALQRMVRERDVAKDAIRIIQGLQSLETAESEMRANIAAMEKKRDTLQIQLTELETAVPEATKAADDMVARAKAKANDILKEALAGADRTIDAAKENAKAVTAKAMEDEAARAKAANDTIDALNQKIPDLTDQHEALKAKVTEMQETHNALAKAKADMLKKITAGLS